MEAFSKLFHTEGKKKVVNGGRLAEGRRNSPQGNEV